MRSNSTPGRLDRVTVRARLIPTRIPQEPRAAVLVLHGGASRQGDMMVSPTQLSVLRMIPIARKIARAGRGGLAVFRLLNSTRGWDTHHTPVNDAHWALERMRNELGDLPVSLVGHSLGGRAALLAGGHPAVISIVALNPFLYPRDDAADLAGREVLIVHGTQDRVAKIENAELVALALGRRAHVDLVRVTGGKHAMLRRHAVFSDLAADFVTSTQLGTEPTGTRADELPGRTWRTV